MSSWTGKAIYPKLMVPLQIDLAIGFDGTCSADPRTKPAWGRRDQQPAIEDAPAERQHTERLAAYWAEALGGPSSYTERYGDETTVVQMHDGNGGPHDEMDQRAIACFDRAMDDVGLSADGELRRVLHDYFAWATTKTMARYRESADEVPDGLPFPRWSWIGLQN